MMDMDTRSSLRDLSDYRDHIELPEGLYDRSSETAPRRPVAASISSGWYHDAAIEQARHTAIDVRCNPYG